MRRLLRGLFKFGLLGAVAAAVVKALQNRSHPDGVVDRNAYNPSPWPPIDSDEGPAKQPAAPAGTTEVPADEAAVKKATPAKKAPAKKSAAKKSPAKKTAAKKTPAKKKSPPKKS